MYIYIYIWSHLAYMSEYVCQHKAVAHNDCTQQLKESQCNLRMPCRTQIELLHDHDHRSHLMIHSMRPMTLSHKAVTLLKYRRYTGRTQICLHTVILSSGSLDNLVSLRTTRKQTKHLPNRPVRASVLEDGHRRHNVRCDLPASKCIMQQIQQAEL